MRTVSKRELNQNTAAVLDEVTESDDVVVTERGKPRWRVSVARDQDSALDRLRREGRYAPPSSDPASWPDHPAGPTYSDSDVDAVLDEIRGDH
ncbi:type II toxin-antitoxin system Phd/YefM family antitoxin [Microlunatus soli]|uniref:Prevent-host-death family protein n=1 Tax=Microlunatus soli TaxID=630515 RepID=A0A1H1MLI9_9ACTN|nr:type II toxin-antitoxin system prevent-host-death family antitoxin [Microlunatus soli]SDR87245.1 prevent-host-death family protein [Microlunatus soli]